MWQKGAKLATRFTSVRSCRAALDANPGTCIAPGPRLAPRSEHAGEFSCKANSSWPGHHFTLTASKYTAVPGDSPPDTMNMVAGWLSSAADMGAPMSINALSFT